MKMIFIGGPFAPSGFELGVVYNMRKSHLEFSWWKEAPSNSVLGQRFDVIEETRPITPSPPYKPKTLPVGNPNPEVNINDGTLIRLKFVKCKSAPSGYTEGQIVELPKRYLRFPWWKRA